MTPVPPPGKDDDGTVPGQAPPEPMGHTLPIGTRLEGLEITGVIGEGGFGIVYVAYDASLEREVAIKEYMPASLAARATGTWQVSVRSERHRDTFNAGLKSFVNEARLLARFDHPALVRVFRFWEANSTAYMVMPYYKGPTLKNALAALGAPPDETQLRTWLRPLLDALSAMHAQQVFHRDISPDNILLTERSPLLLDFGAARRVIGDMTQALTVVLKPGYAPIEQYGEAASLTQGAWTDLYALASVVHYAITGRAPTSAVERIVQDKLQPLALRVAGRYSDGFLQAIDRALAVLPQDRPQDVVEFRALLDAGMAADSRTAPGNADSLASGFQDTSAPASDRVDLGAREPPRPRTTTSAAPSPTAQSSGQRTAALAPPSKPAAAPAPHPPDTALPDSGHGLRTRPALKVLLATLGIAVLVVGAALVIRSVRSGNEAAPTVTGVPPPVVPSPAAGPKTSPPGLAPHPVEPPPTVRPEPSPPAKSMPSPPARAEPAPPVAVETSPKAKIDSRNPTLPSATTGSAAPRGPNRSTVDAPSRGGGSKSTRCSEILERASLGTATPEDMAHLQRECR